MSNLLRISFIQSDVLWCNTTENLFRYEKLIEKMEPSDLLVLPEMFNTGFSMQATETAEEMDGETVTWMQKMAKSKNMAITGSLAITENNKFYNRLIFAYPDESIKFYDKKHLFILSDEHKNFEAGNERIIIDFLDWKIKPQICYDLRFPVWARNVEDYDLLIYVANWPKARRENWNILLNARAIENQCFTLGVNRIGTDGNPYEYVGNSLMLNPIGEIIFKAEDKETVKTITLDKAELQKYRTYFPVLSNRDNFELL